MRLLERQAELRDLEAVLDDALAANGSLALVEGPAGIGKTALLEAARERAQARGVRVLTARAAQLESRYSYGVVRQWLERDWARWGPPRPAVHDAARRVLSLPPEPPVGDDASFGVLHALYWFVADLAEDGALVLALDDAQWADLGSLRFLAYLARRLEGVRVGVLLSVRRGDPGRAAELAYALARTPRARVLAPGALSGTSVATLLAARLGTTADPGFVRACHRATGGNPHFLMELGRAMEFEGIAPLDAQEDRVREITPAALERYVLDRLAAVSPDAARLAAAMTVVGDGGSLRHAAQLAEVDLRRAGEVARALVRAEVLRRDEPVRFTHPLVARVIAAQASQVERDEAHVAMARRLVAERAPAEQVAGFLLRTRPAGRPWCVRVLRAAAHDAMSRSAVDAAGDYLRRAELEPPPADEAIAVWRELAAAEAIQHEPGAIARWQRALDAAREPELRAAIALEMAAALVDLYRSVEACALLERALGELGPEPAELRGRLEGLLASSAFLDASTAPVGASLLARAPHEVAPGPAARAIAVQRALGMLAAGEPAERVRATVAVALAEADERDLAGTFESGLTAMVFAEGFDVLPDLLERFAAMPRVRLVRRRLASRSLVTGMLALRLGNLGEAELQLRASLELTPAATSPGGWLVVRGLLADALIAQGRCAEAEAVLAEGPPEPWPDHVGTAFAACARVRLRLAEGRLREALEALEPLAARERGAGWRGPSAHQWKADAAPALAAVGRGEEARALIGEEVARARRFGAPRALGSALRAAGVVQPGGRGLELLEEAVRVLEPSPALLEHGRARVELGAALRRAGRRVQAREHLDAGLRLAQRAGARPLAQRAYGELLTSGKRLRRVDLDDRDALTAGERRIARLAAEGLTNREIAQSLYLSIKTIEMHLGRTYRKLDITARSELPQALERAS